MVFCYIVANHQALLVSSHFRASSRVFVCHARLVSGVSATQCSAVQLRVFFLLRLSIKLPNCSITCGSVRAATRWMFKFSMVDFNLALVTLSVLWSDIYHHHLSPLEIFTIQRSQMTDSRFYGWLHLKQLHVNFTHNIVKKTLNFCQNISSYPVFLIDSFDSRDIHTLVMSFLAIISFRKWWKLVVF